MNNLDSEVTVKVKEAIRAKLKEMKVNSSDEIVGYIMLLVTTKKTTAELAKSIDFVMENNTNVFVKWLSTIIKQLQQVNVPTTENDVSVPKESIKSYEKYQAIDDLICENNEKELNNFDKVQEGLNMFDLSAQKHNLQKVNEKKLQNSLSEISKSDINKNKISPPVKLNKIKEKISFFPIENVKEKNTHINKQNINGKLLGKVKNDSELFRCCAAVYKQNTYNNENIDHKNKRPRISIYNNDEDGKNTKLRLPITFKETPKLINKELSKKNINKSKQLSAKTQESEKNTNQARKNLSMHDLTTARVDHQRGALALDTAFKYIQQQIGASDNDILVIKKWRDYAIETLRSYNKT